MCEALEILEDAISFTGYPLYENQQRLIEKAQKRKEKKTMIKDHKNRLYKLIGCNSFYTWLECLATGSVIKIANQHFRSCGFYTLQRS